jgi:hypothetical protein
MAKQEKSVHKKSMGRPPGIKYGGTIPARFEIPTMEALDAWAEKHDVNRSEAIRRLVELGLKVKTPARPVSKPGRRLRAKELATKAIEKIIDRSAPPDERALRRRRLTKGPPEFREDRVDLPKAKGK